MVGTLATVGHNDDVEVLSLRRFSELFLMDKGCMVILDGALACDLLGC